MSKVSQFLVVLLANIILSSGKSIHQSVSSKQTTRRASGGELGSRRREVRPIEPGYNHHGFHQTDWKRKSQKKAAANKRLKRCFCGPYTSLCPNGFSETEMDWPCPREQFVSPHYPPNGPPYEVGDDWAWLEDNYEGDLEKNVYGWNWDTNRRQNGPTGYTYDGYPCGHSGWCCEY